MFSERQSSCIISISISIKFSILRYLIQSIPNPLIAYGATYICDMLPISKALCPITWPIMVMVMLFGSSKESKEYCMHTGPSWVQSRTPSHPCLLNWVRWWSFKFSFTWALVGPISWVAQHREPPPKRQKFGRLQKSGLSLGPVQVTEKQMALCGTFKTCAFFDMCCYLNISIMQLCCSKKG